MWLISALVLIVDLLWFYGRNMRMVKECEGYDDKYNKFSMRKDTASTLQFLVGMACVTAMACDLASKSGT